MPESRTYRPPAIQAISRQGIKGSVLKVLPHDTESLAARPNPVCSAAIDHPTGYDGPNRGGQDHDVAVGRTTGLGRIPAAFWMGSLVLPDARVATFHAGVQDPARREALCQQQHMRVPVPLQALRAIDPRLIGQECVGRQVAVHARLADPGGERRGGHAPLDATFARRC